MRASASKRRSWKEKGSEEEDDDDDAGDRRAIWVDAYLPEDR